MTDSTQQAHGRPGRAWRNAMWLGAAALLALPAVAMRYTAEVDWDGRDFILMGVLLAILCGIVEVGARLSDNVAYRFGTALAALTGFLTIWVNLAVGMIGDDNPQNLVFAGVLAIAVVGASVSAFRARGLARTMVATAIAQLACATFALLVGTPREAFLISLFALPWLLAAGLYRRAAQDEAAQAAAPPFRARDDY